MGVKDLWPILEPIKCPKRLAELRGLTLAVDLSIWIVEAKTLGLEMKGVAKPHLRNLFFRVATLLHLDILPVIVVEGVPPDLKQEVMQKRLALQGQLSQVSLGTQPTRKVTRKNFTSVIRECCEMLDYLGVPYVQSSGEAEAMCAFLNRHKIVDGCITNDGDVFLYGATRVYRNFSTNSKDPHVNSYCSVDLREHLKLDRDRLIGLAILLGCDYLPKGVSGVGREQAMKLIATLDGDESLLSRFESWTNPAFVVFDQKSIECTIRKKALATPGFPFPDVVSEFLNSRDRIPKISLTWKRPKMFHMMNYAKLKMEWPESYGIEKMLPLVTRYDMKVARSGGGDDNKALISLVPHRIAKTRVRHGVACYEVHWLKPETDCVTTDDYYVTIEEQQLFSDAFPDLVRAYSAEVENRKPKLLKKKESPAGADIPATTSPVDIHVDVAEPGCSLLAVKSSKQKLKAVKSGRRRSKSVTCVDDFTACGKSSVPVFKELSQPVRSNSDDELPDLTNFRSTDTQRCGKEGKSMSRHAIDLTNDEGDADDACVEVLPLLQRLAINTNRAKTEAKSQSYPGSSGVERYRGSDKKTAASCNSVSESSSPSPLSSDQVRLTRKVKGHEYVHCDSRDFPGGTRKHRLKKLIEQLLSDDDDDDFVFVETPVIDEIKSDIKIGNVTSRPGSSVVLMNSYVTPRSADVDGHDNVTSSSLSSGELAATKRFSSENDRMKLENPTVTCSSTPLQTTSIRVEYISCTPWSAGQVGTFQLQTSLVDDDATSTDEIDKSTDLGGSRDKTAGDCGDHYLIPLSERLKRLNNNCI